ncbi:MAG: adenylyltransferase/cytidyltransferase family protein [Deltaproteobacteria bacterium]|jgi:glycerol-3-phosphate cytidylyltransferase|nr:adenylyltransferase/cytidyltransferase family protein [Deltaproteobacteria bacterium]MBW2505226.1 adenylyltransferase/cytidyltransferase family protein [Deltaproteobacteria bacterium]
MKNEVVGYTTGVFDLFHIGHLRLLQRAKKRCDHLIVGVSTDELVEEYKNKKPVIPFEERVEIISALKCVDRVVPQKNRDKIAAYHEIKFDVMFVGSDWKGSELFTKVELELAKYGVDVVYFEYTNNVSSTELKSTLQAIYDSETLAS